MSADFVLSAGISNEERALSFLNKCKIIVTPYVDNTPIVMMSPEVAARYRDLGLFKMKDLTAREEQTTKGTTWEQN